MMGRLLAALAVLCSGCDSAATCRVTDVASGTYTLAKADAQKAGHFQACAGDVSATVQRGDKTVTFTCQEASGVTRTEVWGIGQVCPATVP